MNRKIKLLIILIFFLAILILPNKIFAKDSDEITNYTTTVNPRNDGTLDIKYHIEWKVLDSTAAGPLNRVKIGIPNEHVNGIEALSNNIKSIRYVYDFGDYLMIDLDRDYKEGEEVEFEFKIHQSYMYEVKYSKNKVIYEFTPGWFTDIKVDQAVIEWKADNIKKHNGKSQDGAYIIWKKKLGKNKKLTAKVEYTTSVFNVDYTKQRYDNMQNNNNYAENRLTSGWTTFVFVALIVIITLIIVLELIFPSSYYWHSGYGYYGGYYPYHHHDYYGRPPRDGPFDGGGFFGGGGSRRRKFLRMCMCLCRRWTRRVC